MILDVSKENNNRRIIRPIRNSARSVLTDDEERVDRRIRRMALGTAP